MAASLLLPVGACASSSLVSAGSAARSHTHCSPSHVALLPVCQYQSSYVKLKERAGPFFLHDRHWALPAISAASRTSDAYEDHSSSGTEWKSEELGNGVSSQIWEDQGTSGVGGLVLSQARSPLQPLSQDAAMGLVLRAVGVGTGWTTGSGLEGPSGSCESAGGEGPTEMPKPILSNSPRRRMRVAFTCNVCGHRTTRAVNPHAYTDGTVFVQCGGCDVFHKLVDNLNLFHELKGRIYEGCDGLDFGNHKPYDFLRIDDLPLL